MASEFSKLTKADCGQVMSVEERRAVQLDMLDAIAAFCDAHGLRYFLSGGTLLGAIRHHGFIPWDDDIDINMPRKDCEKLFKITNGQMGKYRICGPDDGELLNNCNWFRIYDDTTVVENLKGGFSKEPYYHPVFIDIFPIEGLPDNRLHCYFHWAEILFFDKMRRVSALEHMEARTIGAHISHILMWIPAKLIGYKRWGKWLQKCSKKYSFDKQQFVGVTTVTHYITKERVNRKDYEKRIMVTFENKEYFAPGDYDVYLTQLYGDYMIMPSVNKQKSDHAFKVYWRVEK